KVNTTTHDLSFASSNPSIQHSSPLAINTNLIKLLFSIPPTSPQALFDTLEDLPPAIINPPPPRPSFDSIERLANESPPLLAMEPPLPSLPPQPPTFPQYSPSKLPPLPPLGPNNPFLLLTHEMFCEHWQRTQVVVDNLRDEMRFILNHILDLLNVLTYHF
nr:hypothetical protein [Tanacetum cinerariifolium]